MAVKRTCGNKKRKSLKSAFGKPGTKPWQPTDEERKAIEQMVAIGLNQEQIAIVIGRSVDSLDRHCRHELDAGKLKANAKIGGKLFEKAMNGDTAALIFWAKTQMGWKETDRHEHTGKDGGPIQHEQAQVDADQFTRRVAGLAARAAPSGGTGQTKH